MSFVGHYETSTDVASVHSMHTSFPYRECRDVAGSDPAACPALLLVWYNITYVYTVFNDPFLYTNITVPEDFRNPIRTVMRCFALTFGFIIHKYFVPVLDRSYLFD